MREYTNLNQVSQRTEDIQGKRDKYYMEILPKNDMHSASVAATKIKRKVFCNLSTSYKHVSLEILELWF